jgi:hypothetical protein
MRASAYLLTVAGTIVVLALGTIVFTIFVDPYRMFATPTVRGLTELKPRAAEQMGIAKTYQLERIAPKTLLLGNSRTEIGLDPMSPQFPAKQRAVFNASYPGRGACTALLMLRDAMAVRIPERVILGSIFKICWRKGSRLIQAVFSNAFCLMKPDVAIHYASGRSGRIELPQRSQSTHFSTASRRC